MIFYHKSRIIFSNAIIIFFCINCFSQNREKADSLIEILKVDNLSTRERVIILESVSFFHPNLDSALYYVKQSLKISKQLEDPILKAQILEGLGLIEQRLGNNNLSLKATLEALKIYEELDLKKHQAAVLNQIATHYIGEKEYLQATNYLEKAYEIYASSEGSLNEALTLINLGEVYRLSGEFEKGEIALKKALELNEETNNSIVIGYSLGNLGMIHSAQNKSEQAKTLLTEAIKTLTDLEDYYSISIYMSELGIIYKKEGDYDSAERTLLEAFTMAEASGLKEQIRDFSKMLVTLYKERNNFKSALNYQEIYQTYQDSLVNKANIKKVEQLKANYEIDKRETEIERINDISTNRKNIALGLSAGVIVFAVLAFLLYKVRNKIKSANKSLVKQKEEITLKEKEKGLLLRELNHRVKNNLQMVSSLLNLQSNTIDEDSTRELIATGKNRVEALSLVHRKLYQEGLETKIEVKPYVEELVLNLLHGYALNIEPEFSIDAVDIDVDKAIPLALIINELVTNTIKHAYNNIDSPELKIVIKKHEETLDLEVIDNGKGYNKSDSEKTNSLGLKLISSLVQQLKGTYKTIFENGTRSIISIEMA